MRKTLITLAALSAVSGAAMAQSQSSVTLYGMADMAIGKAASAGDQKWGFKASSIVNNLTSRIGFRGREDLGGGLWAGFTYEGTVNLDTGATPANVWSRMAWVGMGSDSFGTVRLGRDYTPGFDGQGTYELTGWANYGVLGNTFGFGGYADPRSNAQIKYKTPNIYGLTAELAYVPKANGGLIDGGAANETDRWGLNVAYNQGPIKAAITVDKSSHTPAGGYADKTNWTVGGSYAVASNFTLSASYNRANNAYVWKNPNGPTLANYGGVYGAVGRRYGWELGGRVVLDAFTITLDLTRDTKNDIYAGHKYTNGVLEGKYALSKRTYVYADYLRLDGNNNFGIGLHHNF